jgi:hypothetical protein
MEAYDRLKTLIGNLKTISFFGRLFRWKNIWVQLTDAAAELQELIRAVEKNRQLEQEIAAERTKLSEYGSLKISYESLKDQYAELRADNAAKDEKNNGLSHAVRSAESELAAKKQELIDKIGELEKSQTRNKDLENNEVQRQREHTQATQVLATETARVTSERQKEVDAKQQTELERKERLKDTWRQHEEKVKQYIKNICTKHDIIYIPTENVPFNGKPDNTVELCNEYIIFDAKSPGGEDLSNFPTYLKGQIEAAKKYVKQDNVKKEIFFVVPTNTLDLIREQVINLADYVVYIISIESLEPIILSLKKIEQYEFAEQLTPEDRENICRVLGKFAHLTKRRIQIDAFFADQSLQLVHQADANLPSDIVDEVAKFEKAEKLNPKMEKRTKRIETSELETTAKVLAQETNIRGIETPNELLSDGLNKLPLYKDEH